MANKAPITTSKCNSPWACVFPRVSWFICKTAASICITRPDCSTEISLWRMLRCIQWPDVAVTLHSLRIHTGSHLEPSSSQGSATYIVLTQYHMLSLHHQCHWCLSFYLSLFILITRPLSWKKKSLSHLPLLCKQSLIMQWHIKPFLPL